MNFSTAFFEDRCFTGISNSYACEFQLVNLILLQKPLLIIDYRGHTSVHFWRKYQWQHRMLIPNTAENVLNTEIPELTENIFMIQSHKSLPPHCSLWWCLQVSNPASWDWAFVFYDLKCSAVTSRYSSYLQNFLVC